MTTNREAGMTELMARLNPLFVSVPLKYIERNPSRQIKDNEIPAVLVYEVDDIIVATSKRDFLGYPVLRAFEIVIELWDWATGDVMALKTEVCKAALASSGVLAQGVTICEKQMSGPANYNIPAAQALKVVFEMKYKDLGPFV